MGEPYGDAACVNCGQKYEYEEGIKIILTEAQIAKLREMLPCTPAS